MSANRRLVADAKQGKSKLLVWPILAMVGHVLGLYGFLVLMRIEGWQGVDRNDANGEFHHGQSLVVARNKDKARIQMSSCASDVLWLRVVLFNTSTLPNGHQSIIGVELMQQQQWDLTINGTMT